MNGLEHIYWYIAIPASVILSFQLILSIFGLYHSSDLHPGEDANSHDVSGHDVPHFQLISVRNVVAFFAMLGWSGIALIHSGFGPILTMFLSVVIGLFAAVAVAGLFLLMSKLATSGNYDINNAVGKIGTVYLPTSPRNKGKVNVAVDGRIVEYEALVSDSSPDRAVIVGTQVKIERVVNNVLYITTQI